MEDDRTRALVLNRVILGSGRRGRERGASLGGVAFVGGNLLDVGTVEQEGSCAAGELDRRSNGPRSQSTGKRCAWHTEDFGGLACANECRLCARI